MTQVSIYALLDPTTSECRYIGVTNKPQRRFVQHRNDDYNPAKSRWTAQLKGKGLYPEMVILEQTSCEMRRSAEKFWIVYMRFLGANLVNRTDNVDGTYHSQEVRKKLAAMWDDPEKREEIKLRTAKYHSDQGRHEEHRSLSTEAFNRPEVRANRARIISGLWADPQHKERRMAAINAPEVKEKQRRVAKEKQTPEMRERIAAAFTPEKREQISQARKAYWVKWREDRGLPPKK